MNDDTEPTGQRMKAIHALGMSAGCYAKLFEAYNLDECLEAVGEGLKVVK